ncbi:unnamed protein product [Acanthoscelides obtectus]|uniref:PiggyBac transposable element-derived protein domain-containing protein n=1 Tax=Acanthoscelides obtectus TaxID=200917 RepID=A0A9P0PMH1_ACAOB|nr:unnamed protein product [Acanthoscelides obtectus]CAK1637622.1 PiggyBac transposable element-derived protein 4 [Acanthoscelides obtectus]
MSRNRALTQKELEEEIERIMQNLSDEASALEDDDDSIADSNYKPIDDESCDSSHTNPTASPMLAQTADTNDDELSVTSGTNSPLPGSSAASAPMPNTDTDDNLAGNAGAASDNMIWSIPTGKNLDQGHTIPTSIVMSLFEPILDSGRTLVTDNWYTSIDLAKRLMDRQTYLIGTLRKNRRGLPKDLVNKKLKCGEIAALQNQDGVTVIFWNDKRNVLMLSTKHSNTTVDTTNRRQKTVKKPEAIVAYSSGKSSFDVSDQMTAYQTPLRRAFKWYRKLAVEIILNTGMVNAWIMYKETVNARISLLQFRKAVTYKLCQAQDDGLAEQPDVEMIPKRKRHKHEMGKSDYKKRRPCSRCYEKVRAEKGWKEARKLTRGRYYCKGCNGEPFFCLSCFNKFHRYETP